MRSQEIHNHCQQISFCWAEQSIVSDLYEALGKDVLEETADEFKRRHSHLTLLFGFGILIFEGDLVIVNV